nr:MAG TPA: hypothetical protein [Caudoviricetes sp.]
MPHYLSTLLHCCLLKPLRASEGACCHTTLLPIKYGYNYINFLLQSEVKQLFKTLFYFL